jgi:hypothetical protein
VHARRAILGCDLDLAAGDDEEAIAAVSPPEDLVPAA